MPNVYIALTGVLLTELYGSLSNNTLLAAIFPDEN